MGDSYDGGEASDSAESNESAESTDSDDDSSAFGGGDAGEDNVCDMDDSAYSESLGDRSEYIGETVESIAPESVYGDGQDWLDMESSEYIETNESDDDGDDESAYGDGDINTDTPDEMSQNSLEEMESETPDEMEVDWDGDEESAYGQEAGEEEDGQNPEIPVEQDMEEIETWTEELSEEEIEALQEQADKVAQEYNDKHTPYDRAVSKGVEGVTETPNGGVSFENSDAIYVTEDGEKAIVTIRATGNRNTDAAAANRAMGLSKEPEGYTWHHLDNYNVKNNTITLELVQRPAHRSAMPHSGGCAQYDAVHGPSYNPPKQS